MPTLDVRACSLDDLPILSTMVLALHQEDPSSTPGQFMTAERFYRTYQELTCKPDKGRILVLTKDFDVVGYAILIFFWSNEFGGDLVTIDELYVRPEYRSQGVATAFFAWLVHEFAGGKAVALALETSPANRKAASFYQRCGFVNHPNLPMVAWLAQVKRPEI